MFGVGSAELIILAILLFLLFGPERLPELMRDFGRLIHRSRQGWQQFRGELERISEDPSPLKDHTDKDEAGASPHSVSKEDGQ